MVLVEDQRFPLVNARLTFQAGSKYDPKDMPGLAEAVASLLTEGTKTRTSKQISEETDAFGGGSAPLPAPIRSASRATRFPRTCRSC